MWLTAAAIFFFLKLIIQSAIIGIVEHGNWRMTIPRNDIRVFLPIRYEGISSRLMFFSAVGNLCYYLSIIAGLTGIIMINIA